MTHGKVTAASIAAVLIAHAGIAPSLPGAAGPGAPGSASVLPAPRVDLPFTERVISTSADSARSVFATDLDGDGDIDVLSTSFNDDKIAWYESNGGSPPTFTERVIPTTAIGVVFVFATDLDGDGDTDVIAAFFTDNKIAWYENNGGSPLTFTERVISTSALVAVSVFAADVDGDGNIDVLSASRADDKIAWYQSDPGAPGPPTFTERVISNSAFEAQSVFATDVDGDGDTDVLSASSLDDKIAWYENDGGSPPTFTERVISTTANAAVSVFATDVDGDGDTDVLSASFGDDKIAWYENDSGAPGPPTFTEHVISTTANGAISVFATDLDGDGDTDVLSASRFDDKIAWYENDGGSPPTFTEHAISTAADGALSVFATDLDGDGDTDVLSASFVDDKIAWYVNPICGGGVVEASTAPDSLSHADQPKNRFLSIVPRNEGCQTALRVTLTSSSTFPGDVGKQWWVGRPREICENSGRGITIAPGDCGPAPGIPKKTMWWSQLSCSQECRDWQSFIDVAGNPLDVLHIGDPDIVTGSVYEIQAIYCQCDPLDPNNYSTALPVVTSQWGDTVGLSVAGCPASGPNGQPISLILDCTSIINKFSNLPCAPIKSRMDLDPNNPNLIITISDVVGCVAAFTGGGYPYPAPLGCP